MPATYNNISFMHSFAQPVRFNSFSCTICCCYFLVFHFNWKKGTALHYIESMVAEQKTKPKKKKITAQRSVVSLLTWLKKKHLIFACKLRNYISHILFCCCGSFERQVTSKSLKYFVLVAPTFPSPLLKNFLIFQQNLYYVS